MIKRTISAVLLVSIVLLAMTASAGAQMQQQQQMPGQSQYGGQEQAGQSQLNIPPAPQKIQPNSQYGNTDRASIIGEKMSRASQGNADVYVAENGNNSISVNVDLKKDADPTQLAPVLANLTYALNDVYSVTDRANNDIFLNVYDTSKNIVIQAKFSPMNNAFDYFNIPEAARQTQPTQPEYGGGQQGGYQGGYQGGQQQPAYGGQQGYM
jgi:hypothetical protein